MDAYIGSIMPVAFNYAPQGTSLCDGTQMQLSQNMALYSLLSIAFGGDGHNTFNLPDLRGRLIVGVGQSTAGSTHYFQWGEHAGVETVTLSIANLANHTHAGSATVSGSSSIAGYLPASQANGTSPTPGTANFPAGLVGDGGTNLAPYGPADGTTKMPLTITGNITGLTITNANTGSNAPFSVMQSYMALNYIIFTEGLYPDRP